MIAITATVTEQYHSQTTGMDVRDTEVCQKVKPRPKSITAASGPILSSLILLRPVILRQHGFRTRTPGL